MIRSKYLGKTFEDWTVTKVQIAGRYGKRKKAKGNSYQFTLTRQTTDNKCIKSLVINHNDMVALARGQLTIDSIKLKQSKRSNASGYANSAYYRFLDN